VVHQPGQGFAIIEWLTPSTMRPLKKRTNERPIAYICAPDAVLLLVALMLDSGRNVP
jgi:hypothetical protein